MGRNYRRTRLWIDPPFQARLLLRMWLYLLLYTLIAWHLGFVFEVTRELGTKGLGQGIDRLYLDFLGKQRPALAALVVLTPGILYDLLKFSHRVAGPLSRCRAVMQEMARGRPVAEFTPRKYDLMREMIRAFNDLIGEWNRRLRGGANGAGRGAGASAANERLAGPAARR
jgi:hypothetical protein